MNDVMVARGNVWHRRLRPAQHAFAYPFWMVWADLDQLDAFGRGSRFWGHRWRPVVLRDKDYLPGSGARLRDRVASRAAELGADWRAGRICMLGQPRMFGWLFNPLVLYWHFAPGASAPDGVLAEVQNTPWKERHCYLLPLEGQSPWEVVQPKQFHVSPFLDMAMDYHWRIHLHNNEISVAIRNHDVEGAIFQAGIKLHGEPATVALMRRMAWRHGLQAVKVSVGIHVHALRLWLKGVPFLVHPGKRKKLSEEK